MINSEMLSVSDLKEAYTRARIQNGWKDRSIEKVAESETFRERIFYVLLEQKFINSQKRDFMNNINEKGFFHYMKELGVYKTTGKGENKKTYCNPYLWVAFAMELNPELYAKVIIWLTDGLIFERLEACNNNKLLNDKIKEFTNTNDYKPYTEVACAINRVTFGKHAIGIRNLATKDQLNKINDLESKILFAIDFGFIKTYNEIINTINNFKIN
jgi:hypothetical protein